MELTWDGVVASAMTGIAMVSGALLWSHRKTARRAYEKGRREAVELRNAEEQDALRTHVDDEFGKVRTDMKGGFEALGLKIERSIQRVHDRIDNHLEHKRG